jgi:hemerythrin-like domain-containing protein
MTGDRRWMLRCAVAAGLGAMAGGVARPARANARKGGGGDSEISAPEDLMREHGVLDRLLLIYEAGLHQMRTPQPVPPAVFQQAAALIRGFVEDYHERLEEQFVFPEFERRRQLADLVAVLRQQHDAGRRLTDAVRHAADPRQFGTEAGRQQLATAAEAFIRMYRPHAAREDTVLFPALYDVMGARRVRALGEQFEHEEHRRFGAHGFAHAVEQVAALERQLGIADLAIFTPS